MIGNLLNILYHKLRLFLLCLIPLSAVITVSAQEPYRQTIQYDSAVRSSEFFPQAQLSRSEPTDWINLSPDSYASSISETSLVGYSESLPWEAPPSTLATVSVSCASNDCRSWQFLPEGLMFKAFLAGEKESRFATIWQNMKGHGMVWDSTLGGRIGLVRNGTSGSIQPEGFQLDVEGSVMPRLDMESKNDLISADFRFGLPFTFREGGTSYKIGYYHVSSHVGDEFMEDHPEFQRDHYVRESFVAAVSHEPNNLMRVYGEVAYAVIAKGNAKPLEFQFGFEYSPQHSSGKFSSPFAAINAHLREDVDFGGSVNCQAGWQWRGKTSDRLWRLGVQYFNGATSQYVLGLGHEESTSFALWFDY